MIRKGNYLLGSAESGGDEGNRTPDLLNAIQMLSQLSYIPFDSKLVSLGMLSIDIIRSNRMSDSVEELQKKIKIQNDIIKGYEKVLRLNEQELENADEIIRMYETIIQYSGQELKDVKEAFDATSIVTNLSRDELISAMNRIKELEHANKRLREESLKFQS